MKIFAAVHFLQERLFFHRMSDRIGYTSYSAFEGRNVELGEKPSESVTVILSSGKISQIHGR